MYTLARMQVITPREADYILVEKLFPEMPESFKDTARFSSDWHDMGLMVGRMREEGYGYAFDASPCGKHHSARWFRSHDPAEQSPAERQILWADTLPHAATIAAILVLQGVELRRRKAPHDQIEPPWAFLNPFRLLCGGLGCRQSLTLLDFPWLQAVSKT